MKIRVRVKIFGKVQGVYFEYNMKKFADRLNIAGWVKSLPDGSIEAVFQGEREAVEKIIKWCQIGPPTARVTRTHVFWERPKPEEGQEFKILR